MTFAQTFIFSTATFIFKRGVISSPVLPKNGSWNVDGVPRNDGVEEGETGRRKRLRSQSRYFLSVLADGSGKVILCTTSYSSVFLLVTECNVIATLVLATYGKY